MHIDHVGTITQTSRLRPFHVQCSCGTAGDFSEKDAAVSYLQSHFAKLGGISTFELVDKSDVVEAERPLAHAAGVAIPEEPPAQPVEAVSAETEAAWPKRKKK